MNKKTIKTEWDLSHFYKSKKDSRIKRDFEKLKRAYIAFEKKYRKRRDYLTREKALLQALQDHEKLSAVADQARPLLYVHLIRELDARDSEAHAMLTRMSSELVTYGNKVLFFELNLSKIPPARQKKFLRSRLLKAYRYQLKCLFEDGKYTLSEPEEKILNLKSLPSHGLWVEGMEKLRSKQTVLFRGKPISIAEAQGKIPALLVKERRALHEAVIKKLRSASDFAESEINAIVLNKKIGDELRGYKEPYSATIRGYENDEKSILALVDTVTKHFSLAHRFYKLKARLMKLPRLTYADRAAPIGSVATKFSFDRSVTLLREALSDVDERYADILDRFLTNGQIDVHPRVGKSGGAYCLSTTGNPTLVLLNHTDSLHSFTTLAHEMGHAIHSEMAKQQPVRYQGYTTSVAETASTLFESIVFEHLLRELPPKDRMIALHDKINDDMATVFRQIAFFNFELELHREIRAKGSLAKEEMAALLNKHTQAYLGRAFRLGDLDGYFFVAVGHFRRFFYVYSYAYGHLISKAMVRRFMQDSSYKTEIEKFLTAGRSKSPEDIFKSIGIDTTKPSFFREGIQSIEEDVARLEQFANRQPFHDTRLSRT